MEITVVKQPTITVSPQVTAGSTAKALFDALFEVMFGTVFPIVGFRPTVLRLQIEF